VLGDGMRGHGPSKDGEPLWWKEIARNKRTMTLKLSDPAGAAVLLDLAADADVLIEGFRPGTFERWGLSPDILLARNPRLVLVRVSGFGQRGPYAHRAGFGTLAEAMSGFAHLTGFPDMPPSLPAFGLADSIAGLAAAAATMMALWHRDSGEQSQGQVIDVNLLAPLMTAVGPGPTAYDQLGVVETRHGNRSTNNAPRNTYLTADDRWVAVSTSAQAIAERVLRLVGHPEVIGEPWFAAGSSRVQHADLLDEYVGSWIRQRTRDEVIRAFDEVGAAVAPVYDARDVVEDEHVRATEMLTRTPDPVLGDVLMHNVMWGMSRTPGRIRHAGRAKGADTDGILAELGYDDERIESLRGQGVVA
jgi:crotonobetainyl-CoA:carnitine CoA-transferase CaiB-like acyl-CoA transferase